MNSEQLYRQPARLRSATVSTGRARQVPFPGRPAPATPSLAPAQRQMPAARQAARPMPAPRPARVRSTSPARRRTVQRSLPQEPKFVFSKASMITTTLATATILAFLGFASSAHQASNGGDVVPFSEVALNDPTSAPASETNAETVPISSPTGDGSAAAPQELPAAPAANAPVNKTEGKVVAAPASLVTPTTQVFLPGPNGEVAKNAPVTKVAPSPTTAAPAAPASTSPPTTAPKSATQAPATGISNYIQDTLDFWSQWANAVAGASASSALR